MAWQSNLPKGCPNIPYRPIRTSGNTWSNALTKVESKASQDVWLYYDVHPKPSGVTGKNFTMDLVIKCSYSANYFVYSATYVDISFSFYSIVTQRWSDYFLHSGWRASDYRDTATTAGRKLWDNYRTYGSYRPAWGSNTRTKMLEGVDITAAGPSYDEYKAIAESQGVYEDIWDVGIGGKSYSGPMPWGVRYMSNGVNAQPGRHYPSPSPFIYKHGQQRTVNTVTFSGLDKGGTTGGLRNIDLSADWIKQRVGTLAGVTAFKMRVRLGWEAQNANGTLLNKMGSVWNTWYFGGNSPKSEAEDTFTTIDNPQIGLLDYGPRGPKETTWPPRFDAQAWYRNRGGTAVKLQAQYKPKGGSWNIF